LSRLSTLDARMPIAHDNRGSILSKSRTIPMEIVKEAAGQRIAHAAKIGVAGVVSILAAKLFKLPQGYWAAISAFVVMGSDVGATVVASRDRLIGTAIGAALGAAFVALWEPIWCGSAWRSQSRC
jgi:uncharacterized membrane protein YccC